MGLAYAAFSWFQYKLITRYRDQFPRRRYLAIAADMIMSGYLVYRLGPSGLAVYPIYLWIIIGNGLRFGTHHLQVAAVFGFQSFLLATLASGVMLDQPAVVGSMIVGIWLMPYFFLLMLQRLADMNEALRAQRNQAEHLATHDVLCNLPNRLYLEDRLDQAIARCERRGGIGAVVFLDLDGFKAINDNYGHDYGDLLLKEVANCLRERLRASDTVARLGGDEFILLIEDLKHPAEVAAVVEQMFGCLRRSFQIGQYQVYITGSCGVALYPQDGNDAQTLIKHADIAMYRAKDGGRNRFCLYDARMSDEVAAQLAIRDELRHALDSDQLRVYYQPLVDARTRRVIGAEALVRWQHPRRGLIGRSEFIPVAEQSGLIVGLGAWVLEHSLQDLRNWLSGQDRDFRLHVNVAALQLLQANFPDLVAEALQRHGVPAKALELEMTESVLIDDTVKSGGLFDRLRRLGVGISLDDFGTGYSSLAYLKRLPVDHIKIDRSFVKDVPDDPDDCALVEATFIFCRWLGKEVIAEGVESETQLDWLQRQGCRYMQGYYFGRPMPAREFMAMVWTARASASK
jgi:diguanylate cyclase (GGDEF)-like protein